MANNRIYLHCKGCGKELFLGKRFASGFYYENYTPEEGTLEEKLNKFYSEHEFCHDEPLECFEIQYEFESTPEHRYIDAIDLIKELQKKPIHDGHFIHTQDVSDAIFKAPTITPEEVVGTGFWIQAATFERCPFCGYETGKRGGMTNYCPDCGKRLLKGT